MQRNGSFLNRFYVDKQGVVLRLTVINYSDESIQSGNFFNYSVRMHGFSMKTPHVAFKITSLNSGLQFLVVFSVYKWSSYHCGSLAKTVK